MAEGLARYILGDKVQIESAGSKPTQVNPFAIKALKEIGIDISKQYSKTADQLSDEFRAGLNYIVTLCAEEVCPVYITKAKRLHWPLPDPAGKGATDDEKLEFFRTTRDEIRKRIETTWPLK